MSRLHFSHHAPTNLINFIRLLVQNTHIYKLSSFQLSFLANRFKIGKVRLANLCFISGGGP